MTHPNSSKVERLIRLFGGLLIVALGVSLQIQANVGASPITTFSTGLHYVFNITIGTGNIITNFSLLVIGLVLNRKYVSIGTVLTLFILGPSIDAWLSIGNLVQVSSWMHPFVLVFMGIVINAFGVALYISADLGMGPYELVVETLFEKTSLSYATARQSIDFFLLAVGFLMGAKIFVGTAMCLLLSGHLVSNFRKVTSNENN